MKYIYLLILNIFTISNISLADDNERTICYKFSISNQEAAAHPNPDENIIFNSGVLWEVTTPKNETNYLLGTIHSQENSVNKILPPVKNKLIKSKKIILEIIPDAEANLIYRNEMYYKDGNQLNNILEKSFFIKLKEQIKQYNLSENELKNLKYMKPWAAFNLIGRPKATRSSTLETNLLKFAQENMLKIDSLETMNEITSSLDELSLQDQVYILKDTICNHHNIIKETKALIDLYIDRDAQGIIKFTHQQHADKSIYSRFMKKMLYERNEKMLEKITKEFEEGGTFVAVGILHLIAKHGILEELQDLGYKITLVY